MQSALVRMKSSPPDSGIDLDESNTSQHKCSKCNEVFQTRKGKLIHEQTHTKKASVAPFMCPVTDCHKTFASAILLSSHSSYHINQQAEFACSACPRTFLAESARKRHFTIQHSPRAFICPDAGCKKVFRLKQQLIAHLRIHTESLRQVKRRRRQLVYQSEQQQQQQPEMKQQDNRDEKPEVVVPRNELNNETVSVPRANSSSIRSIVVIDKVQNRLLNLNIPPQERLVSLCSDCGALFDNRAAYKLHFKLHNGNEEALKDLCGLLTSVPEFLMGCATPEAAPETPLQIRSIVPKEREVSVPLKAIEHHLESIPPLNVQNEKLKILDSPFKTPSKAMNKETPPQVIKKRDRKTKVALFPDEEN